MIVNQEVIKSIFKTLKTEFQKSFEAAEPKWEKVATLVPSTAKQNDYAWLSQFPMMREWVGEKVVKSLSAFSYTIVNKNYEATIAVRRDDIEDDNLGIYKPQATQIGSVAKLWPDELVFSLLSKAFDEICYDGQPFIDTDHPVGDKTVSNYQDGTGKPWFLLDTSKALKPLIFQQRKKPQFVAQTDLSADDVFMKGEFKFGVEARGNAGFGLWQLAFGSKADLNETNFRNARAAMRSLKTEDGKPLNIFPTTIVVPPSLEGAAEDLFLKQTTANGTNPLYKAVEVIVVPWLE